MAIGSTGRALNTAAIRYFQEVVRAGSFRKAADRIHIAASAINRHVRLLEEELGARLFERGKGRRGIKLTSAGEVLARRVQYALNELDTARDEIQALKGVRRGRISIGVTDILAKEVLPDLLAAFHAEHPAVDFDVKVQNTPALVDLLTEDRIDVLIAFDVAPQMGVRFIAEYFLPSSVAVPEGHPLARRKSVGLAELAAHTLAMPDESPYLRAILSRMGSVGSTPPSPFLRTNSYELMRSLVRRGLAISLQTRVSADPDAPGDGIIYVPVREPLARYSVLCCCMRSDRRLPVASEMFLALCSRRLNQLYGH
ncbi:MAG: LysR family transcriptional regulator [Rhizobiales bacterium]|nr:LysR family transcriptional regulator [Hyphomicrobiales bacterium]